MTSRTLSLLFLLTILGAAALRLPALGERPMHCDEAVHADKFGTLLEGGGYRYDPTEYHGPTLNFFTLIPARLRGMHHYQELDETVLRLIPALFGILLVWLLHHWREGLGARPVLLAAVFTALSPALVYYSRYYIQEMLLLCFSFGWMGCFYRYLREGRPLWAVSAGMFFGLSFATKETFILSATAAGSSIILTWAIYRHVPSLRSPIKIGLPSTWKRDTAWALVTAMAVTILFFSSFFSHFSGIPDAFLTFTHYDDKVQNSPVHSHPWFYYLQLLLYFHPGNGWIHTEALLFLLGGAGMLLSLTKKPRTGVDMVLLRFTAMYTLSLTVIYSLIDYKTPWCSIQFWIGWILLAAWAAVELYDRIAARMLRGVFILLLVLGTLHLGWQAWLDSFPLGADPRNPYVYAHTGKDVFSVVSAVERLAKAHTEGYHMPVQVIGKENFWPLPWYFRRFSAVRWWTGVPEKAPKAPVLLATPDMEAGIIRRLYELPPPGEKELYMQLFRDYTELRPGVEIRGYVARSLWEDAQRLESPIPAQ